MEILDARFSLASLFGECEGLKPSATDPGMPRLGMDICYRLNVKIQAQESSDFQPVRMFHVSNLYL